MQSRSLRRGNKTHGDHDRGSLLLSRRGFDLPALPGLDANAMKRSKTRAKADTRTKRNKPVRAKKPTKQARSKPARPAKPATSPTHPMTAKHRRPAEATNVVKQMKLDEADTEAFWAIIERVKKASSDNHDKSIEMFRTELSALDDPGLLRAEAAFCAAMQRAYTWNVLAAAYVIHGGTSEDSFWDVRAGLVALGRDVFEAAMRDPDTLATIDNVENRILHEGFQYVPGKLLEERGLASQGGGHGWTRGLCGERWTDDAELRVRFPKLTARFS
jgi:hypothetical protein